LENNSLVKVNQVGVYSEERRERGKFSGVVCWEKGGAGKKESDIAASVVISKLLSFREGEKSTGKGEWAPKHPRKRKK